MMTSSRARASNAHSRLWRALTDYRVKTDRWPAKAAIRTRTCVRRAREVSLQRPRSQLEACPACLPDPSNSRSAVGTHHLPSTIPSPYQTLAHPVTVAVLLDRYSPNAQSSVPNARCCCASGKSLSAPAASRQQRAATCPAAAALRG